MDDAGIVQGPFTAANMSSWFLQGYIQPSLRLCGLEVGPPAPVPGSEGASQQPPFSTRPISQPSAKDAPGIPPLERFRSLSDIIKDVIGGRAYVLATRSDIRP